MKNKKIKQIAGAVAVEGVIITDKGIYNFREMDKDEGLRKSLTTAPPSYPPDDIDMEKVKEGVRLLWSKI